MLNMSLMIKYYYGSVIPHDWYVSFENFGGLPNVVDILRILTSKAGTNQFFKVWTPMSSVKCHTPIV